MEQLPKTVVERMRAESRGDHPDADLLTAFTERTITERERNQVLEHLGVCRECRDVVALATKEAEATAPAVQLVRPARAWARWPVLKWGAAAACVVIVGAAVFIGFRPGHSGEENRAAVVTSDKQPLPSAPAVTQSEPNPASEPSAPSREEARTEAKAIPPAVAARRLRTRSDEATSRASETNSIAITGRNVRAQKLSAGVAPPAAPAPTSAPVVAEKSAANRPAGTAESSMAKEASPSDPTTVSTTSAAIPVQALPSSAPNAGRDELSRAVAVSNDYVVSRSAKVAGVAPARPQTADSKNKKQEAATAQGAAIGGAVSAPAPDGRHGVLDTAASAAPGLMDFKAPTWSLSNDGLPQRSFNSGATWEKIQVDRQTGFRALSANGMDVWVGGRAGLLYHSPDIGLHWTRVVPASSGVTLASDIKRIDFTDQQHGTITTSGGETWTTQDAGKTWTKQ